MLCALTVASAVAPTVQKEAVKTEADTEEEEDETGEADDDDDDDEDQTKETETEIFGEYHTSDMAAIEDINIYIQHHHLAEI